MPSPGILLRFSLAFVLLANPAVFATTRYVNTMTGSNSNNCLSPTTPCKSIGHAISLSSSGDTISVAAGTYPEHLTIGRNLKLVGAGAAATIVDGGQSGSVVTISGTPNVSLSKITIHNGHALLGGGINNNSGTVTLNNDVVAGNSASQWGGGIYNKGALMISNSTLKANQASVICTTTTCHTNGGAIFNDGGIVSLNNATVSGNSALLSCRGFCVGDGGGIFNNNGTLMISMSTLSGNSANEAGGIENRGTLTMDNSTVSGNSANFSRGNAFGGGIDNNGTLKVSNSTFNGNSAVGSSGSFGGGIRSVSGTAKLQNTIVANSASGGDCYGTIMSNGYNLSSDSTCNFNNSGDLNGIDPKLGTLGNYGGLTKTIPLLSGSPAIDTGNPNGCTDNNGVLLKTDQRARPRPDDEDSGGCDIGAFEDEGTLVGSCVVRLGNQCTSGPATLACPSGTPVVNPGNVGCGLIQHLDPVDTSKRCQVSGITALGYCVRTTP